MSLSCNDLVWDLGHVSTATREVDAFIWLWVSKFLTLTDWEGVRVVEHIGLCKSCFGTCNVLDRNIGLGQPLSLNVNTLLVVILLDKVLTLKVGDLFDLLVLKWARVGSSHLHCGFSEEA